MSESAQLLHLVDHNGQAEPICADCVNYEWDLKGKRLQIAKLEHQLARTEGTEPEAADVRTVLEHWAKRVVEEGWWSRRPAFRPGHPRWSACAARLREPEYDIYY